MTLTRRIAINTIIQTIGKILYFAFSLVIVMLITRHLGVDGYGQYNMVISYLALFAVLADLALYMVMVREISQQPKLREKIVNNVFGLRIFSAILAMLIAIGVSFLLGYPMAVKIGIAIFSVGIFFMLLNQMMLGVFQVDLRMDKATIAEVSGRLVTLLAVIWLIKNNYGLIPILIVSSGGFGINFILNYLFIGQHLHLVPKFETRFWKKILINAWPLAVVGILGTIYFKIDTVILSLVPLKHVLIENVGNYNNLEAVGLYGAAYRVLDIIIVFPALFAGLVFPQISFNIKKDFQKTQFIFQRAFDFLLMSGIFVSLICFILAPQIIDIIAGPEFVRSVLALRILSVAFFSHFVGNLSGYTLTAAKKQIYWILPLAIFCVVNIIANIIFIPYYSFIAAATITAIGELAISIIAFSLIWKHVRLAPSLQIFGPALLAGAVTAGAILLVIKYDFIILWSQIYSFQIWQKTLAIGLLIAVAGVIYFMILYILGAIKKEDLRVLR